jgi:hypothetical protein
LFQRLGKFIPLHNLGGIGLGGVEQAPEQQRVQGATPALPPAACVVEPLVPQLTRLAQFDVRVVRRRLAVYALLGGRPGGAP